MPLFSLLIIIFNFALLTFNLRSAVAQNMSNDNYILQLKDIDTAADKPQAKDNTLGVSDQQVPKQEPEPKLKIQAGFLHDKSKDPFTFSISETLIYFGHLSPTNPITRSNKLTASNGSTNGYSVIAFEDRELWDWLSDTFIPDTSCNDGLCSESSSAPWTNILTYGLGYRCDNIIGSDCLADFSDLSFYKQFANNSKNEIPQKVLSGTNLKTERIVQITYKVNISGTQPKGSYQNIITYIAVPNF